MTTTRRQVLEVTLTFAAASLLGVACGSEETTPSGGSSSGGADGGSSSSGGSSGGGPSDASAADTATAFECRSSISENHGHRLVIPVEHLDATSPQTYSIIGSSDHDHQVTFDAAQLADLKAGISVQVTSTDGGTTHDHVVNVKCS